jgi:hypothetical protein
VFSFGVGVGIAVDVLLFAVDTVSILALSALLASLALDIPTAAAYAGLCVFIVWAIVVVVIVVVVVVAVVVVVVVVVAVVVVAVVVVAIIVVVIGVTAAVSSICTSGIGISK